MYRVFALTADKEFFDEVEQNLTKSYPIEFQVFSNSLDLIDQFLMSYAQLIVLDIDILNEQSIKLIHILRSIQKDTKIILILSKKNLSICLSALSMGVISYQVKPISFSNTCNIINSSLKIATTN